MARFHTGLGVSFTALGLALGLTAACGGDDEGGTTDCPTVSGSWVQDATRTTCPISACTVTQTGCSVDVDCGGEVQGSGWVGATSGNAARLEIDRGNIRCTGSVRNPGAPGSEIDVACDRTGGTCDTVLSCDSASCSSSAHSHHEDGGAGGSHHGDGGTGAPDCGPGQVACGVGCMPADAVCCDNGYCPPETTCGPDDTCTTGGGGDVTIQEFCNLAVNGLCTCFEGTAAACTTDEAQGLYDACVAEDPAADFVLCFGAFVDMEAGTVLCREASETCLADP